MKRFLLHLLIAATALFASASNDWVLQVWKTDGQVLKIGLDQEPKTSYDDGQLIITTLSNTVSFPLESVRRYTYSNGLTGLDTPNAAKATFSNNGETLTFTGLRPNTEVTLYNVAGQLLRRVVADGSSHLTISVSDLAMGVYVVKADHVTYKITKR